MADIGPVVDATVSRVIAAASGQINLVWGWKADLKRFRLIMKMLGDVLQDADEKQVTGHPRLQAWLEELRAVADEADDMLEDVAYHNLRRQVAFPNSFLKMISYLFTPSNHHPLVFRLRMANKVKNLNIHLVDVCDWAARMGLQYKFANPSVPMPIVSQQTYSFLPSIDPSQEVIGRDTDVNQIVSWLIDDSSKEEALSVIFIWGMSGVGKTTLAKAVSVNDRIEKCFGKNMIWVSVSANFDVQRILGEMLESLTNEATSKIENRSALLQKIREELEKKEKEDEKEGKNYLLILDDVLNEDGGKWDELRNCLLSISKNPGNGVVVTTRSEKVALTMETLRKHIHPLKKLEDNECWPIIKGRAFGKCTVPSELVQIGERIGSKCGGSPLVATVIGGTLCSKRDTNEWRSVESKMDKLNSLEDQDSRILHALKLSFDQLPKLVLKQCFAFCSIFPRAVVMKRAVLIQLWMAEGFLRPSKGNSMEDMGTKYFDDLLSYSLLEEEKRDDCGNVISCKMHDLTHDLAKLVSKFETVIFDGESSCNKSGAGSNISISDQVQHLNLIHGVPTNLGDVAPKLCTLFLSHCFPCSLGATKFKRLRVLSFVNAADVKQLPTCFDNSKSLRYLNISGTQIEKLPKFFSKLYNLQTFKFRNCTSLEMPSRGIGDLINLSHIDFSDEDRMPANLGRLTNLQTLPLFFVGTTKGRRIEELGSLSGLKGNLEIRKLELVKSKSEAEGAKLHEKAVEKLGLWWVEKGNQGNDEEVLEGLQPHSNLKSLGIIGYGGEKLASWMWKSSEGGFSSLQRLCVFGCDKLTGLGEGESDGDRAVFALRSLKELFIVDCPRLNSFSVSKLSSLEQLHLTNCNEIRSMGDCLSSCTCLKQLYLSNCPKLECIPSLEGLHSLKTVTIFRCNELQCLPDGLHSSSLGESESDGDRAVFALRSLKELFIVECPKLNSFSVSKLLSLEQLRLTNCNEIRSMGDSLSSSTCLKQLYLSNCPKLECIPCLEGLHSLKTVTILRCNELQCLPDGLSSCTAMEELSIWRCNNLVYIPEELKQLSSLVQLAINICPNLKSFPEDLLGSLTRLKRLSLGLFSEELEEFPNLTSTSSPTSLENLYLEGWGKVSLPQQIQRLTTLKGLIIKGFNGVEEDLSTYLGKLSGLKGLKIEDCPGLRRLSSGLSSVEDLAIINCTNLFSLQGALKDLPSLFILRCPKLAGFLENGIGCCTRLKTLGIGGFSEELVEFPSLRSIHVSLERLGLIGWEKLSLLPQIEHLTALKEVSIQNFPGVESLPDWFKNFSSLQRLFIRECPKLKERCTKGSGLDWDKISYIPYIQIDGQTIQFQSQH